MRAQAMAFAMNISLMGVQAPVFPDLRTGIERLISGSHGEWQEDPAAKALSERLREPYDLSTEARSLIKAAAGEPNHGLTAGRVFEMLPPHAA